ERLDGWVYSKYIQSFVCPSSLEKPSRSCRLDGPRQAWGHPRPRGSAFGVLPGEVLAKGRGQGIISARTPEPYPRMKTAVGCRTPDSWRENFSLPPRSAEAPPGSVRSFF